MKKIVLILIGSFCLTTMAVQAQTPARQDTTTTQSQSQNYRQDMDKIQASDVPASLRTTLGDARYKGWEKGTIYRGRKNDGYVLEMRDANNNNKMTTYRFDAQGKLVPEN